MIAGLAAAVVVPAAGSGSRIGAATNKLLLPLAGEPLLAHTLRVVAAAEPEQIVLVCRPDEQATMAALAAAVGCPVTFADGGATRQQSVARGLQALADGIGLVAVHDGARPLLEPALLRESLEVAAATGAAVVAVPVADTLQQVADGRLAGPIDRAGLWAMQTPQSFRREILEAAHRLAAVTGYEGTDETSLVERAGQPVTVVPGSRSNLKVTLPEDFALAEALLSLARETTVDMRVGYGYDVHRLVAGRELWLGGVRLDSPVGLLGHSDADALIHAICDALLGAVGEGDIGRHFPDTDPQYEGISSVILLEHVGRLVADRGWQVVNIDATVVAERPKLAPYVPAMIATMAGALGLAAERVNVKATTHEKLGALGAGEGLAAHAVALVKNVEERR